jgi:large subunit ribosomal protein L9
MPMQIILTQDVDNLGKAGELVSVRPGYGRNYLVPRGMAVSATVTNKNRLDHEKALIERKVAKERASATEIAARINGMTLQFERNTGEDEKLFGSVTSRDIAEALQAQGVTIDSKKILLEEPIRALGMTEVPVKLGRGVQAKIKVWVVKKE